MTVSVQPNRGNSAPTLPRVPPVDTSGATMPGAVSLRGDAEFRPQPANKKKGVKDFTKVDPELAKLLDNTQKIDNGSAYISAKHNSSGPAVKFWQEQLKEWAVNRGGDIAEKYKDMQITDSFASNPQFTSLIKDFQREMNVVGGADGVIGPRTFRVFASQHFESTYGAGSFKEYTTVDIIPEEEYQAILEAAMRSRSGGYAPNLPLPNEIDAKTILSDEQKLKAFETFYNSKTMNGKPAPISAKRFLELCAEYNFDPSLALAQAIQESHIGTNGDRPISTRNIFNVGNVDSGSNNPMDDWESGMRSYLKLMTSSYGNNAESVLARDFQRVDGGGRYATDSEYNPRIRGIVGDVRLAIGAKADYQEFFKEKGGAAGVLLAYHQTVDHLPYDLGGQRAGRRGIDCSEYVSGFLKSVGCTFPGIPDTDTLKTLGVNNGVQNFQYGSQQLQVGDVIVWGDGGGREGHTGVVGPNGVMFESTTIRTSGQSGAQAGRTVESFIRGARGREIRVLRPIALNS